MKHQYHIIPDYITDRLNSKNSCHNGKSNDISSDFELHNQYRGIPERELISSVNHVYNAKNLRRIPKKYEASSITEALDTKDLNIIGAWVYTDYFGKFCAGVLKRKNSPVIFKSVVHYSVKYNNAFNNGIYLLYGDGDNIIFNNFDQDPSVVFFLLWQIVSDQICFLDYSDQSGSLKHHLACVFSSIIMQWMNGENVDEASWLIGEKCMINNHTENNSLFSLSDPGTAFSNNQYICSDPQVGSMSHLANQSLSFNIVINSGILNRAFYIFSKLIGGYSWNIPCDIWYTTLTTPAILSPNATFLEFANATLSVANELYGSDDPSVIDKLRTS